MYLRLENIVSVQKIFKPPSTVSMTFARMLGSLLLLTEIGKQSHFHPVSRHLHSLIDKMWECTHVPYRSLCTRPNGKLHVKRVLMVNNLLFILSKALLSSVMKSRGTFTLQIASSKPDVMYFVTTFSSNYAWLNVAHQGKRFPQTCKLTQTQNSVSAYQSLHLLHDITFDMTSSLDVRQHTCRIHCLGRNFAIWGKVIKSFISPWCFQVL